MDDDKINEMLKMSRDMLKKSYSPYSNFPVGATLLCEDGTIFTGCNVENASYGLSMCAERTAIFKAVSEGHTKFTAIVVSANIKNIFPCGACRQVLAEFGTDWDVYISRPDMSYQKLKIHQLLPNAFTPDCLKIEKHDTLQT